MTTENSSFESASASEPRALGILLRAIRCYSDSSIQLTNDSDGVLVSKRDFTGEARVAHDVLLQCCQILLRLSELKPEELKGGYDTTSNPPDTSARHGVGQEPRESNIALWEILGDAANLLEAMIGATPVNLPAWASFNNVLTRDLNNSAAARRLTSEVTASTNPSQPGLAALTERLSAESLGADLNVVFSTLLQQLEFLGFIESSMKARQSLKPLLPVFMLINADTSALLEHIEKRTLKEPNAETAIIEALDGTAYAIRMELRKAFEHELAGVIAGRQPHHVYARMENAHGLLRDCFQQSIVSLAQLFDPDLQGTRLFSNFQAKLDQSLSLRRELWRLLRAVRRAVESRAELHPSVILEIINTFRENSLRLLMYKDRESFERFVEEMETAHAKPQVVHILHRFEAYLETLFTQVNMRAVLMKHPFDANDIQ